MTKRVKLRWFTMDGHEWPECQLCLTRMADPVTVDACASVGLEHGKSTHEMMKEYLAVFHETGHE